MGQRRRKGRCLPFVSCKMKRDKKGGEGRRQPNHVVNETKKAHWLQMIQKNRMDSEVGNYVTDNQFHSKPTCETICKSPLDKGSFLENDIGHGVSTEDVELVSIPIVVVEGVDGLDGSSPNSLKRMLGMKSCYSTKRHNMQTGFSKAKEIPISIETGVVLGFDFNRKEK
ncbi:hypothetical protein Q3G72_023660 [Acer saccharum]|nr:hypothetical protein Q3G72_023660 [Acer saccharum]